MIQQGMQMFGGNFNQQTQGKPEMNENDAVQEAIRLSLEQTEPKTKEQKTEVDEESFEDLYEDAQETTTTPEEPKKQETKVLEVDFDAVAMENTKQIMSVFNVPEDKKEMVYKWVQAKETNAVNELLNLYIDEMAGRI